MSKKIMDDMSVEDPSGRLKKGMKLRWKSASSLKATMHCGGLCAPCGIYERLITQDDIGGMNGRILKSCAETVMENGGNKIPCEDDHPDAELNLNQLMVYIHHFGGEKGYTTCSYEDVEEANG